MAKGIAHRRWVLHRDDYQTEADFRQAVEAEMVLNVQIMERLGVAIVSAPLRTRINDGDWFTAGIVFETATVPGARQPEAEADPMLSELGVDEDLAAVGFTDD